MSTETYNPSDFKEQEMHDKFMLQLEDAKLYFDNVIKPRLDRSYKLYMSYSGDRQKEIQDWQANIFVPYINAVVETLMPRILDARPEFTVQGRNDIDQKKAYKQQQLIDYTWEISEMDKKIEDVTRSSLVYGTGFMQVYWRKEVKKGKYLKTKDISEKKLKYKEEEKVIYDAPYAEPIDNYSLWYDWHNTDRKNKQYWIKRLVLTGAEIKLRYPGADKKRLRMALAGGGGDLTDYASIRNEIKKTHERIYKGAGVSDSQAGVETVISSDKYNNTNDENMKMYEVFEWWRPFEDSYAVIVGDNYVPILKGGEIPIPYDFKEAPFIEIPYLKLPNEFEGYGFPMLLENPQLMLNLLKNQRLDAATLNIHKMWIVNPMANINKNELVVRPFGIIYSPDPQGVREVEFSDIKPSSYREEELLKSDMRYSSGVDDFSMGAGGQVGSATEVRHLRESTLERVRLFVNHLGDGLSDLMRYWLDMWRQFFTQKMQIRILGDDGNLEFPLIEKDDLLGYFDYKATVLPSFAGQNDIKKKQDMDLFQLLVSLPFVDPMKLTSKLLHDFNWSLDSISKGEQGEVAPMAVEGTPQEGMPAEGAPQEGMPAEEEMIEEGPSTPNLSQISPDILMKAIGGLRKSGENISFSDKSSFSEMANPINLLKSGTPPTAGNVGGGANLAGFNRGGKVNTNIPLKQNNSPESNLMNRALNIQ